MYCPETNTNEEQLFGTDKNFLYMNQFSLNIFSFTICCGYETDSFIDNRKYDEKTPYVSYNALCLSACLFVFSPTAPKRLTIRSNNIFLVMIPLGVQMIG